MRRLTIEIAAATALTLAALVSLASHANASDVMVSGPFARASAFAGAKSGAVYMSLSNNGSTSDHLLGVTSDVAGMASVHETMEFGGMASMKEMGEIQLAPGAAMEMKPGGMHIMLMGLKHPLRKGTTIHVTLKFEKAGEVLVDVPVGGVAASSAAEAISPN